MFLIVPHRGFTRKGWFLLETVRGLYPATQNVTVALNCPSERAVSERRPLQASKMRRTTMSPVPLPPFLRFAAAGPCAAVNASSASATGLVSVKTRVSPETVTAARALLLPVSEAASAAFFSRLKRSSSKRTGSQTTFVPQRPSAGQEKAGKRVCTRVSPALNASEKRARPAAVVCARVSARRALAVPSAFSVCDLILASPSSSFSGVRRPP